MSKSQGANVLAWARAIGVGGGNLVYTNFGRVPISVTCAGQIAHLYDVYLEISGRTIGKNYRETGKPQGIRK